MNTDAIREFDLEVTPKICKKVYPIISPGDVVKVSTREKLQQGTFVLVSYCEDQWIEKFYSRKPDYNYYQITKVIMKG